MDVDYSIDFYLYATYSKPNIRAILETGKKLGFVYTANYTSYENIAIDKTSLKKYERMTIDTAIVILYFPNFDQIPMGKTGIQIYYNNISCDFTAYCNKVNQLDVVFFDFNVAWEKKFEIGKPEFGPPADAARYIRLLLKLFKDFEVKGMQAYIWNC